MMCSTWSVTGPMVPRVSRWWGPTTLPPLTLPPSCWPKLGRWPTALTRQHHAAAIVMQRSATGCLTISFYRVQDARRIASITQFMWNADDGFQGSDFQKVLAKILPHLTTEIIKRSDRTKGFGVLPRRWFVERTMLGSTAAEDSVKDWESLNRTAPAFLRLVSICPMLRELCNPA